MSSASAGQPPVLVARVLPDLTGLDRQFDYLIPEAWTHDVRVGTQVRVQLNGRRVGGWVSAVGPPDGTVALSRLLPLAKVSGHGPSAEIFELAEWAQRRWSAGRIRPFLVTASPPNTITRLPSAQHGQALVGTGDPAARRLLDDGGGVLRLPPSASLVPALLAACERGPTLVVTPSVSHARRLGAELRRHGRTVAQAPIEWASAAGGVDVVIGARTAAWAPAIGLRSIVVVDEHDEGLQEERQPTWHGRDVAIERARRLGIPCLLLSPVPSLRALMWANERLERPSISEERAGWPTIEVVDRSREEPWQTSMVSSALIRQLRDPQRRVVCVLNVKGRSKVLACRSCRTLQRCEQCDAAIWQDEPERFVCPRCQLERPAVCQQCGAGAFANLRKGVSRLREELQAAAGRPVVEVTASDESLPDADIYVGTEAVLHRVRSADTVAFLDFDAELIAPRYRANEQAMTLLARAARIVGGRNAGGRLIIHTFLPRNDVIDAIRHSDPARMTSAELDRRRLLRFPPFAALAVISGKGTADYVATLPPVIERATLGEERMMLRVCDAGAVGGRAGRHAADQRNSASGRDRPAAPVSEVGVRPTPLGRCCAAGENLWPNRAVPSPSLDR